MPEDFVPTTSMERAYAQARHWPADRAWRRAYVEVAEGHPAAGMGMYLTLLDYYARRDGLRELFDTCEWILTRTVDLKPIERLSICRIVCHIVKSLKEDEFDLNEARLKLILRIPLAVILEAVAEQRLSCALTGLLEFSRVFDESLTLKKCAEFEGDYSGVALSIDRLIRAGKVRDDIRESEKREAEAKDNADSLTNAWHALKEAQKRESESQVANDATDIPWTIPPLQSEQSAIDLSSATLSSAVPKPTLSEAIPPSDWGMEKFGLSSTLFAHRCAALVFAATEPLSGVDLDEPGRLNIEIETREGFDLSPYVMQKLFASVGNIDEKKDLLSLLTSLEVAITSENTSLVGLDVSLGATLWRLIWLWYKKDCLVEGFAYLSILQKRLASVGEHSELYREQVNSAKSFVTLLITTIPSKEHPTNLFQDGGDSSVELLALLAATAVDSMLKVRQTISESAINELLWLYSDTVGDASRRIGEMLWLLQETSLNNIQRTNLSLIHQSQKLAETDSLAARLVENIRRAMVHLRKTDQRTELLAALILAKSHFFKQNYEKAFSDVKEMLSLVIFAEGVDKEAENERIASQQEELSHLESNVVMNLLEELLEKKDWTQLSIEFKNRRIKIDVGANFYRVVQIGLRALDEKQLTLAMCVLGWIDSDTTALNIGGYNFFIERFKNVLLSEDLVPENKVGHAATILEFALQNRRQSADTCNRLRVQLAELEALNGNFFQAIALIYQAFSNIP